MAATVTGTGITFPDSSTRTTARAFRYRDKAIFGYGTTNAGAVSSLTNLVSITGTVTTDVTGVGLARESLAAASYGGDKAIFGYGFAGGNQSVTNIVSNLGVVATDTTGVGTARIQLAAAGYGGDKAIFGYGQSPPSTMSTVNLVSNIGVVSANVTGVGTARCALAAASYGLDKAIFGYGGTGMGGSIASSLTNLVSNVGVVAADVAGVGTARRALAAASYGDGKVIFGYGRISTATKITTTNLVSNVGVVSADDTGVGTGRDALAATSFGS